MKKHLLSAFEDIYGLPPKEIFLSDDTKIRELAKEYSSWEYIYGTPLLFDVALEIRFDFGNVEIQLQVKDGIIRGVKVYTDSLDITFPNLLESALSGLAFRLDTIRDALSKTLDENASEQIAYMFENQLFS